MDKPDIFRYKKRCESYSTLACNNDSATWAEISYCYEAHLDLDKNCYCPIFYKIWN